MSREGLWLRAARQREQPRQDPEAWGMEGLQRGGQVWPEQVGPGRQQGKEAEGEHAVRAGHQGLSGLLTT